MSARPHDRGEKDLFDQFQTADRKIRKKTRFLLPRLKNTITLSYENIIFITIGFIMSCIIFFSLGVEKGREDSGRITRRDRGKGTINNVVKTSQQIDRSEPQDEYIIQLAAFTNIVSAEQEAERLKREGYSVNIKKSGNYYQLYIGGFKKRKAAELIIEELKEKYKDCYIKRIGG